MARLTPSFLIFSPPSCVSFRPETMPAKKQTKSKMPKRSRARSRRARVSPLVFTMSYPVSKRVRLTYIGDGFQITESAAGVGAFRYFRLNSAYDVDTTLGSTTIPGFAEWSAFYSNYRVWSTAVHYEGSVQGGSAGSMATVCLVPNSSQATLPSSANTWPVQPQTLHRTILMYGSGGANKVTFTRRYDIASIFRVTRSQFLNDFDFSATTSSNPARQAYLAITVQGNASSSAVVLTSVIYFSMEVEFFNPIQLST